MKNNRLSAFLFAAVFFSYGALYAGTWFPIPSGPVHNSIPKARPYDRILSPEELRSDFSLLQRALVEAHGGLYRFCTPRKTDKLFKKYGKRLKHPMDVRSFDGLLCQMLSQIGDGHMRIDYDETALAGDEEVPLIFPFTVMFCGGKMIVHFNDTENETSITPGTEILSINGYGFFQHKESPIA